jgi:L-serine deaminase
MKGRLRDVKQDHQTLADPPGSAAKPRGVVREDSHTVGPMRITDDFYQQAAKLPADKLAKATTLQVNLFGSLSATGKGHGTERAALAGLVGKEPVSVDPNSSTACETSLTRCSR